eukprot:7303019-Heterocapsa_arctica.AAC.1
MDDEIEFNLSSGRPTSRTQPRTLRLTAERPPIIVCVGGDEKQGKGSVRAPSTRPAPPAPRSTSRSTRPTT